ETQQVRRYSYRVVNQEADRNDKEKSNSSLLGQLHKSLLQTQAVINKKEIQACALALILETAQNRSSGFMLSYH
ncbi:MAG: hypothetical protein ACXQTH_00180, partial [Dehalococcoidia bacterium]